MNTRNGRNASKAIAPDHDAEGNGLAGVDYRFPALEIRQGPKRTLYSFAVDGKDLCRFATVARLRRASDSLTILGYQRPEVLAHIAEIRDYLESPHPMIPNSIVVAFDRRARFEAADMQPLGPNYTRVGVLVIPASDTVSDAEKPGWIVDGQQRVAAVRDAQVAHFPICVTAFITSDEQEEKEQFILVNSTKPLPKGLIYELLPQTGAHLPSALERRRFPALLLAHLNFDIDSPLAGLIRTPTNPDGVVKDNAVLKMLENSLIDGALHQFRDSRTGGGDLVRMLATVKGFWTAVREVFPDAWGSSPRNSRLMHGAGIVSMGFVMDTIAGRLPPQHVPSAREFQAPLARLRADCRWTSGIWKFADGTRRLWNEIQNTPNDIQLLSAHLLSLLPPRPARRARAKNTRRAKKR